MNLWQTHIAGITKYERLYRAAERIGGGGGGGPGQIQKVGPHKMDCVRGVGGTPPGNFEMLHALKCVLGAPEAPFRACTRYIYTCKLLSSISGFRSKSTTYVHYLCQQHKSRLTSVESTAKPTP